MEITNVFQNKDRDGKPKVVSFRDRDRFFYINLYEGTGEIDFDVSKMKILTFQKMVNTLLLDASKFNINIEKYI